MIASGKLCPSARSDERRTETTSGAWACAVLLASGLWGCGGETRGHVQRTVPPEIETLDVLAGRPGGRGWADGELSAAHFQEPWEIVGDDSTFYLGDANVIRAIDRKKGTVSTVAGTYPFSGSLDGVGTKASFNLPSGVVLLDGDLYVSDTENHTLRKIELASGTVTTIAGAAGKLAFVDGPADEARFAEPEGIALDSDGNLYIADTDNNTIRVLTLSTGMVATVAGSPDRSELADGIGQDAAFFRPRALRIDSAGNVFVADSLNLALRKVVPATGQVTTLANFEGVPQGIAFDGDDVLVSVSGHSSTSENRIVRVTPAGKVSTVAGSADLAGYADGPGASALFDSPAGLWRDGSEILIADTGNFVIRALSLEDGTVSTYAGAQSRGSEDGTGTEARFNAPQGLAADDVNAYVADTGNQTIRQIDLETGAVKTLAGTQGKPGDADGHASSARFHGPQGLALDRGHRVLYVADTINRRIRQIELDTGAVNTPSWERGPSVRSLDAPSGLALDGGKLYVTDSTDNVVVAVDLKAGKISDFAGSWGVVGSADGVGSEASFHAPTGIAADGQGSLFVVDRLGCTVRKIEIATATVSTLAGIPGTCGSTDGAGSHASFSVPFGITANDLGDLFVADTNNNTIRHVKASNATVTTPIGATRAFGVELGALPAQLSQPSAVCLTTTGGLLIVSENAVLLAH
jgi:sugar lactone lactonase YvrE